MIARLAALAMALMAATGPLMANDQEEIDPATGGRWIICADPGLWCELDGNFRARLGVKGDYAYADVRNGFDCTAKKFGRKEPLPKGATCDFLLPKGGG